jgi:hypothetical protein
MTVVLVKYWSNDSGTGQILVKYWSKRGRRIGGGRTGQGRWSNAGQMTVVLDEYDTSYQNSFRCAQTIAQKHSQFFSIFQRLPSRRSSTISEIFIRIFLNFTSDLNERN